MTHYNWARQGDATSNAKGEFWFTQLDPGVYEVVEVPTGGWMQSTLQPAVDPDTRNINPATSTTAFQIGSRVEYVWEFGAASRVVDGMGGPMDGKQDAGEKAFGYNKGALKIEHLATPNANDVDENGNDIEPGNINRDLIFGNFKNGKITGFKFEDVDKDGIYDPAIDRPLANVIMTLTGVDGMGNNVNRSTTTDASGMFMFSDVKPGSYQVTESAATDTNNDGTPDVQQDMVLDTTGRGSVNVTVVSDTTRDAGDWANYVYGSIHGYKFHDLDADGTLDVGEPDLADIQFDLYKFTGTTTETTASGQVLTHYNWARQGDATSNAKGEFWFTQLDPGVYEVVEVPTGGWIQSTLQPTVDPDTLNTNPATSTTAFQINSRVEYVWEFGAASRVVDGMGGPMDGKQDAGEKAFGYNKGALKVEYLATPDPNDTDENGNDIEPGNINRDLVFGNFKNGKITGFKFEDVDKDGTYDPAIDRPLANVTMTLSGVDGMGNNVSRSTTTDASGMFMFGNLKPGSYQVAESAATDTNNDGTPDVQQDMVLDTTGRGSVSVTVVSDTTRDAGDWANYVYGSIHGYKFHDLDADGRRDAGEPDLANIQFDLYKFTGTTTETTASGVVLIHYNWARQGDATSNAKGEFWFTQLDPGVYEVVEVPTGGWMQSTLQPTVNPNIRNINPATSSTAFQIGSRVEYVWEFGAASRVVDGMGGPMDGKQDAGEKAFGYNKGALKIEHLATPNANDIDENGNDIEPGNINRDLVFGNFKNGKITGFKFEDVDKDGIYDPAIDRPLANVIMTLSGIDGMGNNVSRSTTTDASGMFMFGNLKPGSYQVAESAATDTNNDGTPDVQQDMVLDTTGRGSVSVAAVSDTTRDAGAWANYVYGSIHGYKFHDLDGDGTLDVGEPDLADIQFDLYKFTGTTTETTASGQVLTHYNWARQGDATSNAKGEFWFTQLDPGVYEVVEVGQPDSGTGDDASDSDWMQSTLQPTVDPDTLNTNPATSTTAFQIGSRVEYVWEFGAASRPVDGMGGPMDGKLDAGEKAFGYNKGALKVEYLATPNANDVDENGNDIEPGNINRDLVFGNFKNGKITGFKFEDVDKDGTYDPAIDRPLANVTMTLTGVDGMGNNVNRSTTTDASGMFMFSDVKPGSYQVAESAATDTNNDGTPDVQQDMVLDTTGRGSVSVTVVSDTTRDAGEWANYVYGSIHGYKFHDLDADGTLDAGEPDLADIQFDLYKFTGTTTETTASGQVLTHYNWARQGDATSNAKGEFWFTQLDPGVYEVVEVPTGGWMQSTLQPTVDPDTRNINPATSTTAFQIGSRVEYVWEFGAASRVVDGMGGPMDGKQDAGEKAFGYNKGALKIEHLATPNANDVDENGNDIEPGNINRDLIFGNFKNGKITGFKFEDVDKDGIYDPAIDRPLANVIMTLSGVDGMGNNVSRSTTTDASGMFMFGNLKPGSYQVAESAATDTNNDGTPDAQQDMVLDTTGRGSVSVTVVSDTTRDAGEWANYVYGSIHGYKFHDLDADGTLDVGEPDLADIQFDLYKFTGTTTETTASGQVLTHYNWARQGDATSNPKGEFWFTQLDPGVYEVVEVPTGGWIQSTLQPTVDPDTLNTNPATSTTAFQIGSRVEYVWEFGAASRPVDGMGGPMDGKLDAGEKAFGYNKGALKVEHLATPNANDVDEKGNDIEPGNINRDLIFGNFKNGKITGFKFEDVDKDGIYDPAIDRPLANVIMTLSGVDGMGNNVSRSTTTDASGMFMFGNLKPGSYQVAESAATDTNNDGTPDVQQDMVLDTTGRGSVSVTVVSDTTRDAGDWANYVYGSIHGYKFHDLDADGRRDAGEPDLANIQFDLYKFTGTTTETTASGVVLIHYNWARQGDATSNAKGEFWFTQLDPGVYEVVEVPTGGWMQSTLQPTVNPDIRNINPATSSTAFQIGSRVEYVWEFGAASRPVDGMGGPMDGKLDAGEKAFGYNKGALKVEHLATPNANDIDENGNDIEPGNINRDLVFGNFKNGKITGFKFEDVDKDGIYDPAIDRPLANVTMTLTGVDGMGNNVNRSITTDASGMFMFGDLKPGSYQVEESSATDTNNDGTPDVQQDMVLDTTGRGLVSVTVVSDTTRNAGAWANYVYGSIHGYKFHDLDADGTRDAGEPDLADIQFDLYKFTGTTTETTASGQVLTHYNWARQGDATSNAKGEFWFTQLDPGVYEVVEVVQPDSGTGDDASDSDWMQSTLQPTVDPDTLNTNPATSTTAFQIGSRVEYVWEFGAASRPVDGMGGPMDGKLDAGEKAFGYNKGALKVEYLATPDPNDTDENGNDIEPGNINRDLIFGNFKNGKITGFKFEDVDKDGIYDPAIDKPLANVTMTLTGVDGMGNNVNRSTTTDAGGMFMFSDVKPGSYQVTESASTDTNNDGTPDVQQDMVLDTTGRGSVSVTVVSDTTRDAGEWANYVYGSIHGYKFHDYNRDGQYDEGEPDLANVTFDLYKFTGTTTETTASGNVITNYNWTRESDATSNAKGEFWFTQLDPGVYEVVERPFQGNSPLVQTTNQPTVDPDTLNTNPTTSTTAFQINSRVEYVWEFGAASRPVDGMGGPVDGKLDNGEKAFGYNKGALKVEYLATPNANDIDENGNDIEPGYINRDLWFGNNYVTGSVHGFKFEDIDGDGIWDQTSPYVPGGAEPGLGNIWIELHDSQGNVALLADGTPAITLTGPDGQFWITDIVPGTYSVHEVLGLSDTNFNGIPDDVEGMAQIHANWLRACGPGRGLGLDARRFGRHGRRR